MNNPVIETLPLALALLTLKEKSESAGFGTLEELAVPLLKAQYVAEIQQWDWKDIFDVCAQNVEPDDDDEPVGRCFIGTVFDVMPSGKYWEWWCHSNVDEDEAIADTAFVEALEEVAAGYEGWIEPGEGDPCDLFFARHLTVD